MYYEVLSNDTSDPVALSRIKEVLQAAHNAQHMDGHHPGVRAMERHILARYYLRNTRELVAWYQKTCPGCYHRVPFSLATWILGNDLVCRQLHQR
jgi:hypothetical protein